MASKKLIKINLVKAKYPKSNTIGKMLSKQAQTLIDNSFNDNTIIEYDETIDHDGYDEDGPESNLWDLYIITEENNQLFYYYYHWEDWFNGQRKEYKLHYRVALDDLFKKKSVPKDHSHISIIQNMAEENEIIANYINKNTT